MRSYRKITAQLFLSIFGMFLVHQLMPHVHHLPEEDHLAEDHSHASSHHHHHSEDSKSAVDFLKTLLEGHAHSGEYIYHDKVILTSKQTAKSYTNLFSLPNPAIDLELGEPGFLYSLAYKAPASKANLLVSNNSLRGPPNLG